MNRLVKSTESWFVIARPVQREGQLTQRVWGIPARHTPTYILTVRAG